ncbi:putative E3 ubiquitin-protein ligase UBR3 [Monocercomonoides exilis]|uniref:putative E3 ubiquitin-protein ligase UBR3 n=1 Tax=Monocercomonoides exilis TaxID=2049356 RepID=UPI003559587C|nr:putative E3 ubiquitin-protein ligase UBR3 [Monocercomonoides exilis]
MSNAVKEIIANHFELFKKWKEEEKQFNILCTIGFGKHWEDTLNMLQKEDTRIEQKCSTIWYGSEKAYKCRTCGLDSSAAICQACFDPEKHIGHDYQMIHATGGTCDCGSDDAWQKSGWCSRHLSNRNKNISPLETFNNSNINRKSYSKLDMREEDYEKLIIKFCKLSKYKKHILQSIILKILGALLGEAQLACQETTQPQIIVKNWKEALVKSISELKSVLLCEKEKDAKKCSTMLGTSEFEGENKEDECHCESEDKHISLKSIQLGNMKKFETRNDRHDEEALLIFSPEELRFLFEEEQKWKRSQEAECLHDKQTSNEMTIKEQNEDKSREKSDKIEEAPFITSEQTEKLYKSESFSTLSETQVLQSIFFIATLSPISWLSSSNSSFFFGIPESNEQNAHQIHFSPIKSELTGLQSASSLSSQSLSSSSSSSVYVPSASFINSLIFSFLSLPLYLAFRSYFLDVAKSIYLYVSECKIKVLATLLDTLHKLIEKSSGIRHLVMVGLMNKRPKNPLKHQSTFNRCAEAWISGYPPLSEQEKDIRGVKKEAKPQDLLVFEDDNTNKEAEDLNNSTYFGYFRSYSPERCSEMAEATSNYSSLAASPINHLNTISPTNAMESKSIMDIHINNFVDKDSLPENAPSSSFLSQNSQLPLHPDDEKTILPNISTCGTFSLHELIDYLEQHRNSLPNPDNKLTSPFPFIAFTDTVFYFLLDSIRMLPAVEFMQFLLPLTLERTFSATQVKCWFDRLNTISVHAIPSECGWVQNGESKAEVNKRMNKRWKEVKNFVEQDRIERILGIKNEDNCKNNESQNKKDDKKVKTMIKIRRERNLHSKNILQHFSCVNSSLQKIMKQKIKEKVKHKKAELSEKKKKEEEEKDNTKSKKQNGIGEWNELDSWLYEFDKDYLFYDVEDCSKILNLQGIICAAEHDESSTVSVQMTPQLCLTIREINPDFLIFADLSFIHNILGLNATPSIEFWLDYFKTIGLDYYEYYDINVDYMEKVKNGLESQRYRLNWILFMIEEEQKKKMLIEIQTKGKEMKTDAVQTLQKCYTSQFPSSCFLSSLHSFADIQFFNTEIMYMFSDEVWAGCRGCINYLGIPYYAALLADGMKHLSLTPGHLPYLDSGIKEDLFDIFLQVEHISNLIAMIASFLPSQLTENDTSTNVLRMPIEEQQTQHESEHLTADSLDSEQEEQKISVPDNCNRLGCLQLFQFVSCLIVSRSSSLAPSSLVLPYHPLCSISKEMVGNEDKTRDTVESANKLSPFLLEECNTPTIPFLATFSYEDVPLPLLNLFFEDVDNQSVDLKNKEKEMFMKYIMTFVFKPTKPIKVFLREVLNEAQRLDQNHVPLQSVSSFEQSSADQLRTQFPLSLFPTHTAHTEAFILALIQRHIHLEPPGTIHNELPRLFAHLGSTLITTVSYHSFHALEAAESECYTPFVPASLTNSLVKFFSSDNTFSSLYEPSIYLIVTHKTQPTHSLVLLSSLPSSYYLSCCQQSILISRGISQEYSGMWRRNDMAFEEIYFIMNYTGYLPDFAGPELFCMQLCVCGAGWDAFFAFMMNVWLLDFFFEGGWCEKRWNELNEERKSRLKRIPYHEENEKEKEKEQYINTFSSEHEKEEQTDSAKIDITKESEKHPSQTISEMSTPFDSIIPSEPERAGVCWSMSTSESFTYASYFLSNIVTICVDRMFPLLPNIEFIQQHQKSKSSSASSSSASYNSFLNPHPVHMEWMYEMTPRYPSSSDSSDTENGQQFFSYSLKEAILESAFGSLFYLNHEIDDSKTLTETNSEVSFTSTSPFFIKVHPISDNSSSDSTSHCESTFLYLSSPFIEYPNRFPRLNPNSRKVVSSCPSFHTSTNQPVVIPFTPSFVASLSSYMISEKSRSYSSMCSLLNPRFTQHPSFEPIIADLCNSSEESNRNRGRSAVSLNTINSSAQVLRSLLPGSSSNSAGSAYSSHSSAKECLSLAPLKILLADPFSNCCRLTARTNYTQKLENTLTSSYCSWNTKPDEKEDDAQAKEERRKKWSICLYKGEELFEEDYIQHAENACSSSHPIFSSIPKHFLPSLLPPLPGLPHVRLPHPSLSHLLDVCCSRAVLGMIWTILHYSLHPSSVQQKIASDSSSVHLPSFGETPSNEGLLIPALRLLDVTICFSAAWRVQEICDIQKSDISIDEKQSSSSSKTNSHLIFQQPQLLNDSKHPLAFPSVPSSLSFLEILFFPLSCTCSPFPSLSQSPANASSHKDDSSECSDCKYSIASLLFALLSSAHSESNPLKLPFSNLIDSKWEEFCKDTDSVEEEKHTKADERFSPDIAKDSTTQSTASLNMAMKAFGMMEEDGKENEENKSDNVVEKKENSNKEDNKEDTKESVAQSNDSKTNQCEIEVDSVESEKKKEELKKQQISAIDAEIAELENQLEKMEAEEETSEVCMYCHGAILKGESAGYIGHLSYDSTLQALNSSAVYHLRDEEERKRKAMEKERREKKDEKRRKKHKHKGKVLTRCHRWNFAKREHFWEDGDFLDEIERVKTAENAMEKGIHKKQAVLQSDCSVKDTMEQPIREKDTDSLDLTHGPLYSSSTTKDVPFSFMLMPFREKGANEDSLLDASKELEPSKTMHLTALPLFHFPKETSKFGDDSSELIGNNMKGLNTPAGFEKHFFGTNKQAVVNELAKFTEQRHRIQTVKKEERFVKWASSYFKMLDKMKKKMKKNKVKFLIKKKAKDKHIQEKEKTKKKRDWEKESRKAEKDEEKYEKALFWKKQDEDEEDEVNEAEKKIYNEQKIESLSTNIAMKLSLHVEKEQDALKEEQSTESSSSNCLLHAPDSDSSTTSDFPFTDNSENDEKNPNQSKPLSSASSRENYSSFIANHRRVPLFRAPEGPLKMRRLSKRNEIEKYLFKLEKWGRELNEWNLAMDTSGCDECGQQSYELNSDESSQSSQKLSNQTSASFSTSFHSLLDSQALQEEKVSLWNQIALGTKTDLWGNSGRDDLVIEDIRYTSTDLSPILECAFPFLPVYSTYDFSSENEASTIATESKKEAQDFSLSNMNYLKLFNLLKLIRIWSYNEEEYTWNPILNIPLNHLTKLIYARQTEDKNMHTCDSFSLLSRTYFERGRETKRSGGTYYPVKPVPLSALSLRWEYIYSFAFRFGSGIYSDWLQE